MNIFGSKVKLQIWDSRPTTRFPKLIASLFRGAHGIIILHDPSQPLASVKHWLQEIDCYAKGSVCKLIVANKCDLADDEQNVDDIKELADELGIGFMNISAKASVNCEECFVNLVCKILRKNQGAAHFEEHRFSSGTVLGFRHLLAGSAFFKISKLHFVVYALTLSLFDSISFWVRI